MRRVSVTHLLLVCVVFLLLVLSLPRGLPAQAQISDESRILKLESDFKAFRNQLQLNRSPAGVYVPTPSRPSPGEERISTAPTYDRLATLVIELKQRVNNLEARLAKLERR